MAETFSISANITDVRLHAEHLRLAKTRRPLLNNALRHALREGYNHHLIHSNDLLGWKPKPDHFTELAGGLAAKLTDNERLLAGKLLVNLAKPFMEKNKPKIARPYRGLTDEIVGKPITGEEGFRVLRDVESGQTTGEQSHRRTGLRAAGNLGDASPTHSKDEGPPLGSSKPSAIVSEPKAQPKNTKPKSQSATTAEPPHGLRGTKSVNNFVRIFMKHYYPKDYNTTTALLFEWHRFDEDYRNRTVSPDIGLHLVELYAAVRSYDKKGFITPQMELNFLTGCLSYLDKIHQEMQPDDERKPNAAHKLREKYQGYSEDQFAPVRAEIEELHETLKTIMTKKDPPAETHASKIKPTKTHIDRKTGVTLSGKKPDNGR